MAEWPLSRVLLMDDARFAWLILVPRRPALEIADLSAADRAQLMEEIARASAALRRAAPCDKLNVGALGNLVAQLHIHVVARRRDDAAWPGPVWGSGSRVARPEADRSGLLTTLQRAFRDEGMPAEPAA